jgi:hypothetical protein
MSFSNIVIENRIEQIQFEKQLEYNLTGIVYSIKQTLNHSHL